MRPIHRFLAPLLAIFLWGCASFSQPDPDLLTQVEDFMVVQQKQDAFLALPDTLARLKDMRTYAGEVSVLYRTESLRLGPLGSALISKHDASLNGHLVLQKFYRSLDESAYAKHAHWVDKIKHHVVHGRDGSLDQPFRALTLEDAHAFLLERGDTVIGTMYGQSDEYPLIAYVLSRNELGHVNKTYFEIRAYARWRDMTADPTNAQPLDVIRALAQAQDNSAQVAYGVYLLENASSNEEKRDQLVIAGRNWLQTASASPNALPPYFLANFEVAERAQGISWERVKARYESAIQLGYTDAHVRLGRLYLQGVYGGQERRTGLELLEEAAALNNVDAATALGSLLMSQAPNDALAYLKQAATLGTDRHRLHYIRTLVQPSRPAMALDSTEFDWVTNLANDRNQEAMILLGTIHARGLFNDHVSIRQARRWYRRSVEVQPTAGEHVNEVAWVLATTHLKRLRNPTLAIKYMDVLMQQNEAAREHPAYIDTWAAAYAAAGNFQRAIELQEEALAKAESTQSDIHHLLKAHLQNYKERKALTEEVP